MEKNDGFVVEVYEMKKILVLSLCFVLALWMAGCVQNKNINFGDVTMKVVEGSVTPSGLTVRISNNTGIDILISMAGSITIFLLKKRKMINGHQ